MGLLVFGFAAAAGKRDLDTFSGTPGSVICSYKMICDGDDGLTGIPGRGGGGGGTDLLPGLGNGCAFRPAFARGIGIPG